MLYMPATTFATPVVLQETQQLPLQVIPQYYMLQPTTIIPAVPVFNTTLAYPRYGFLTQSVETSLKKVEVDKCQLNQVTQHVIHHHVQTCSTKTCPGYCELCCPWIEHSRSRSRSRSPSPPTHDHQQIQRHSRRDEFERHEHDQSYKTKYDNKHETIDDKIERVRHELGRISPRPHHKSTETTDLYHPPSTYVHHIPYKQHYDAPKSCSRSRSRSHSRPRSRCCSRSRSASSHRASSLTREPWRSTNQNDYPWRDSHLPAYRQATLSRSQTPTHGCRSWKETAHERSHSNTRNSSSYYDRKDYIYRPKSETETRKWYMQSTGKDPDREVYQALCNKTTAYNYSGSSMLCHGTQKSTNYDHSFYSDVPTYSKIHTLKQIDSTHHHNLYGCNEPCLHVVPKHCGTLDPPYLKILNAPVTYLH